jgi:hypothetical protein
MEKELPFSITGNCSEAMNYLVYVQNIYLNKYGDELVPFAGSLKFPYMDVDAWGLLDSETFKEQFRLIWSQAIQALSSGESWEVRKLMYTQSDIFQSLFNRDEAGSTGLEKSYLSFKAWWKIGWERISEEGIADFLQVIQEGLQNECFVLNCDLRFEFVYDRFHVVDDLNFGSNVVLVPPGELMFIRGTRKLSTFIFEKIKLAVQHSNT